MVFLTGTGIQEYNIINIHIKYITNGSKNHSIGLCNKINRVNKLLQWYILICPNYLRPEGYTRFHILR